MAWNEPGNNGNKRRDPWGSGNTNEEQGKGTDDPTPQRSDDPWKQEGKKERNKPKGSSDFDDALGKLKKKGAQFLGQLKQSKSPNSGNAKKPPRNPVWIPAGVVVVAVAVWAGTGFYTVNQSQQAVVLRWGKYLKTNTPGLHWSPSLIDRVNLVNVAALRSYSDNKRLLTADNNLVDIRVRIQYQINDPREYAFNVQDPEQTLRDSLNATLTNVIGGSGLVNIISPSAEVTRFQQASAANDDLRKEPSDGNKTLPLISAAPLVKNSLLSGREDLAPMLEKKLQSALDSYHTGLSIQSINVERVSIPDDVQSAANDVADAENERQQAINNAQAYGDGMQPLADGEARRLTDQARVYQDTVVAKARGETARFLAELKAYKTAPDVTRERLYLQTLSDIYHDHPKAFISVGSGSSVINLPLDQLNGLLNGSGHKPNTTSSRTAQPSSGNTSSSGQQGSANSQSGDESSASQASSQASDASDSNTQSTPSDDSTSASSSNIGDAQIAAGDQSENSNSAQEGH